MASNINPSLTPVNNLANFRFWCQKVLPLVYDDSLSYYEVLGKMVVQLNDVIDNINADTENVLTLKDAFLELQTYVNNFFDDIDQLASYAERAEAAQTAANTSAVNAATSASNASASSLAAMDARDTAVSARQAAQASANTASTAATNANTKANEAAQSAITAQTAQASASQSATLAATDRSAAQTAASTATTKANEANTSATNAETSANNAAQSKEDAEEAANNIQENLDNIQQNAQDISDLKTAISENFSNTATKVYAAAGSGWLKYNLKAGHTYKFSNIGSSRFTDIETTNTEGYTYIEQVSNGFNKGADLLFVPTQDAKYIFAYATGSAKYSVTDITTNKELFDDANTLKNVDLKVSENALARTTDFASNSEYISLNPLWEIGGITNATGADWNDRFSIRTQYIYISSPTKLILKALSDTHSVAIIFYDSEKTRVTNQPVTANSVFNIAANTYIRVWVYGSDASPANSGYVSMSIVNNLYDGIPEYYKTYMENKLPEIRNAASYIKGITFPFITDVHLQNNAKNSGKLINYINENTNSVPFVIFGGDVPKAIDTSANVIGYANEWTEYMATFGKNNVVQIHGNHDYMCRVEGTSNIWFAPLSTVFEYVKANDYNIVRPPECLYGAIEIPQQGIAIIIADNYDASYNISNNTWNGSTGMSNAQLKWIANYVLNTDATDVLFISHEGTNSEVGAASTYEQLAAFDTLIKAIANKTTTTIDGDSFDFTSWQGSVIGELCGHTHIDKSDFDDGVLYVSATCDCYVDDDPEVTRTLGTVSEQAFDVVNIDTINKTMKLIRIGGGSNRAWNYNTGEVIS